MITFAVRRSSLGLSALTLVLLSCSAATPAAPKVEHPVDVESAPAFASPAHWAYFPRDPGVAVASLVLPDAAPSASSPHGSPECLVLTSGLSNGDRWLVHGSANAPCSGPGTASASPAVGEPLVGVWKEGAVYRFVSASGVVYEAAEPLGAFVRTTFPDPRLVNVSAEGGHVVGVDSAGRAYYFDESGWKRASLPSATRVLRIGIQASGRAVAIALPETLLVSTDGGRTYTEPTSSAPRIGATDVVRTPTGELAIVGTMGKLLFDKAGTFSKTTAEVVSGAPPEITVTPALTPQVTAFREGRAQITGDQYYDLRYPESAPMETGSEVDRAPDAAPPPAYVLARGPMSGPLETRPLKGVHDCDEFRLAAHGKNVVIACSYSPENQVAGDIGVRLFESTNGGDEFATIADLVSPSFSNVYLAVGADGSTLVTNVCRPASERKKHPSRDARDTEETDDSCRPKAPILAHVAGGKATMVQGTAGHLANVAFSPVIAPDGRLYFIGSRVKDDRAAIFVSTDGGKTFDDHTIDAPPPSDTAPGDDPSASPDNPAPTDFGSIELSSDYSHLTVDESGTLGVGAQTQAGFTWVTTDADVHLLNIGVPPEPAAIAGFGKRIVAVGYGANDGVTRAYESVDGGASFSEIATTPAIFNFTGGDTTTVCGAGGCLLGDALARIGWEGEAEATQAVPDATVPELDGKLGAAIACELTPKTAWTPIKNTVVGSVIFPRLSDMMRGKTAWSVVTEDSTTRAIDITTASMPDKESEPSVVATRQLMGPLQPGAKTAWELSPQAEGYIAARVAVPSTKGKLDTGKPINGVEVNWANFFTGAFGHRTLSDAGKWSPSLLANPTFTQTSLADTQLLPAVLTIAGSGVVFRATLSSPKSVFFDAQARTTPFDYPDWSALGLTVNVHGDASMAGSELFAAAFVEGLGPDGAVLSNGFVTAHKPPSASEFQGQATTFAGANAEIDWAYLDTASGVEAIYPEADGSKGEALVMMLKADGSLGEPTALPTLLDLPEKPRACTPDDRKNTPRAYMPVFSKARGLLFPDGRRPVLVSDGTKDPKSLTVTEPQWFLSDGAILHGTPKDPCLAGLRASSSGRGLVVVIAGDMTHAWMFRPANTPLPDDCGCDPNDPLCDCTQAPQMQKRPTKGRPKPRAASSSSVEWRPMTCRVKPDLAPPPEITGNILVPAPEDGL